MKKTLMGIAAIGVAVTAMTAAGAFGPSERRAKAIAEYQPVGEAVNCVSINQIRSTKILDNRTIDFKMNGGKVYRNTLPNSCPGLLSEESFSYRTSQSQLCHVDVIRVLHNYGGQLQEGAGCGLGKFQPVQKVPIVQGASYVEGEWAPFEVVEPGTATG